MLIRGIRVGDGEYHLDGAGHYYYYNNEWLHAIIAEARREGADEDSILRETDRVAHTRFVAGELTAEIREQHLYDLWAICTRYCVDNGLTVPQLIASQLARYYTGDAEERAAIFPGMDGEIVRQSLAQVAGATAEGIRLATPIAPTVAAPPRIKVKIARGEYETWDITIKVDGSVQNIPRPNEIRPLLPKEYRQYVPKGRYNRDYTSVLENGMVPANVLADALRVYFANKLARVNEAEASSNIDNETASLLNIQPATLLVGGLAYRLVPAGGKDSRGALRGIRQRAIELARAEAQAMTATARADAELIVRNAEAKASQVRAELERERLAVARRAPDWLLNSGKLFCVSDSLWEVRLEIALELEQIEMYVERWDRTLYWDAVPISRVSREVSNRLNELMIHPIMAVKVKFDNNGAYSMESCRAVDWQAPHIGYRACMRLQNAPARLTSIEQLNQLEEALGLGNRIINMNSLLVREPISWHPWIRAQVPEVIIKMVEHEAENPRNHRGNRESWPGERVSWQSELTSEQVAAGVFTVRG